MQASHNIIRVLSKLGVCSRKQAVEYVQAGRVRLNGKLVLDPGTPATVRDTILVDGKPPARKEQIYIIMHKPAGCVTTRSDELGRKTVYEYLGETGQWLFPVGRLDLDSEGLLLFTNDTDLGNRLTDPHYRIRRTYNVTLDGQLSGDEMDRIRHGGIDIGRGETTGPTELSVLNSGSGFTVRITLAEGKNRELRRLFEVFGRKVLRLLRTDFGGFTLGDIPSGQWRKCALPDCYAKPADIAPKPHTCYQYPSSGQKSANPRNGHHNDRGFDKRDGYSRFNKRNDRNRGRSR